jgi:cobalt-zinc-cadmium efflux system membrane fusion protein
MPRTIAHVAWGVLLGLLGAMLGAGSLYLYIRQNPPPRPATNSIPEPASAAPTEVQIDLTADDLKKVQIKSASVAIRETTSALRVPGIVRPNEYRQVHVVPIADGIVKQVAIELGSRVHAGQPLATIFSGELADAETQYLSYVAELDAAHKQLERTQTLLQIGAVSRRVEEEATSMHAVHEAHLRAARERLKLLVGLSEETIAALAEAGQTDPNITVTAPVDGVVLARMVNPGQVVSKTQELFTVADLSTVWIMASLNEKDFSTVRVGTQTRISTAAYPGQVWLGRVAYIDPQLDPNTRTAQARTEVGNPGESLRFQMYVDIEVTAPGVLSLTIPESAVQSIGDRQFVFLPLKDREGSFAVRTVRLGPAAGGYYPVLEGLKSGDEVVTEGSFILKAESARQYPELK